MGEAVLLGASLASTSLQAAGGVMQGASQASGSKAQAAKAQRAAEFARLQADETDVQMREELRSTLANIDAIRASADVDPNGPTAIAIKDEQRRISDRERNTRTMGLRMQANQYEQDAQFYRKASKDYMMAGLINGGSALFGGLAKGFGPGGFGKKQ